MAVKIHTEHGDDGPLRKTLGWTEQLSECPASNVPSLTFPKYSA
jgi:hypothetical protein